MNRKIHPALAEHLLEENEKLRGLLREIRPTIPRDVLALWCKDRDAALSQQAEPVEPAPAQDDGRTAFKAYLDDCAAHDIEPSIAGAFHFAWVTRLPPPPYMPGVEPESMTDYERGEAQGRCDMWEEVKRLNATRPAQTEQQPDDAAVDRFAAAMKAKLAKARAKGRGGWDDPETCSVEFLAQLLVEHLGKGNAGTFEDVANFCMMLHQRGADPMVLAEAAPVAQTELVEALIKAVEAFVHDDRVPNEVSQELAEVLIRARRGALAAQGADHE